MLSSWTPLGPPVSQDRIITSFPKVQSSEHFSFLICLFVSCLFIRLGLERFGKRSRPCETNVEVTLYPSLALKLPSSCRSLSSAGMTGLCP